MSDTINKIDSLVSKAHALWRDGKENEMLNYLYEAKEICKDNKYINRYIEILNEYGGGLRVVGRYDEAISSIEEALSLIKEHYSSDYQSYATTLMNLGNIYRAKKDFAKAEDLIFSSKEIFEKNNDISYSYIGTLNNLSLVYQEMKEYKRAETLQLYAISLLEKDDKYNIPLAISYNNLYEIQKHIETDNDKSEILQKAKDILLKEVGENHPLYCSILNNLGEENIKAKNYGKALSIYEKALNIAKNSYGTNSEAYIAINKNYEYAKSLI